MDNSSKSGDPGRGDVIIGVSWTLTTICTLFVAFRLYQRSRPPTRLGWDDWIILLALVLSHITPSPSFYLSTVISLQFTVAYHFGAGKHDEDLTLPQLIKVLMWFWISTTPALIVSIVARISASILLVRIFRTVNWFKWFVIVFTTLQTIVGIVAIITIYTQASPIQALWDPAVKPTKKRDRRYQIIVNVAQSLFAFSDLSYVFLPVFIIWRLNMPLHRKIGLAVLLSLSLISFVGSVMKPVTASIAHNQYESSLVILWSNLEQTLVIIISCVPALRSLVLLEMPIIRSIGSSLRSLITPSSWKGSMASSSSRVRTEYHDIDDMQETVRHRRVDRIYAESNTTMVKAGDQSEHSVELGPYIRRTDQFDVSHELEQRPGEGV
ncbi:hypothetical protein F4859DRAFT_530031 [Xylaria cf. heliscus]|nr:hypothetical protein F4859DRAFT_530031 [Xylaria cf. heliscus]